MLLCGGDAGEWTRRERCRGTMLGTVLIGAVCDGWRKATASGGIAVSALPLVSAFRAGGVEASGHSSQSYNGG